MELSKTSNLILECLAIGSLPHDNSNEAMEVVKKYFSNVPFWPQLAKVSKNEDMLVQYLENMPSFSFDEDGKVVLDSESDTFFEELETFFMDYEEIIENKNFETLEKYGISKEYSSTFDEFIEFVRETTPQYVKGQVTGPFTLSTSLCDKNGRCAIYDETLKEIIVKTLILKALWQIKKIKEVSANSTPIIFIDEPSISQLGTSAYISISENDVVEMIKEVSDAIKSNGGLSAIHCCGKCDWNAPIRAGINIINLDAYAYAQNLSVYSREVKGFLQDGGIIAWGVIPTLDKDALQSLDIEGAIKVFDKAVKYLTKKGIDEKIIIDNSVITPSCGAGSLTEKLAIKAMSLTKELSERLKEQYLKR